MMKTGFILTWLLCTTSIAAQEVRQDYHPMARDGKTWEAQVGGIKENLYGYRVDGDTLINGDIWKKVYSYVFYPRSDDSYYAAIRDVDKRVYIVAKGSNTPRLLYDFDLKVGNTIKCGVESTSFLCLLETDEKPDTLMGFPFKSYLRVERIDTIKTHDMEQRRITLTLLDTYKEPFRSEDADMIGNVVWVEGVGSGSGPFSPWLPLLPRNCILLRCFDVDKKIISGVSDFYDQPEPNAISNIPFRQNEIGIIYDLLGRRQNRQPRQGIYIRGGRKRVVKD
ncbi:MAG: hypothetical protein IKX65_10670 [Prevotella sp.]|nr:hypothetical protein [Prevotella sp.]